jgi:hypothetical protein
MKVQGRCHCGGVSYEAEVDPEKVSICHCTDCQMLTGAALSSIRACSRSGVPSPRRTAEDQDPPPSYTLRVGCLRQRAELPPRRQIWCRSSVPWSADLREISKLDRQ